LPRRRRDDVAFELRALLAEELQGRADTAGRAADDAMALALVRDFGAPDDVAGRYRTPLTIVDPADGPRFVVLAAIGLALIWSAGLFSVFRDGAGVDTATLLGRWWGNAVLPSPWWPGVLVVWFGLKAWARRRRSAPTDWTPRPADAVHGGRTSIALGLVAMALGTWLLIEPTRVLDIVWRGTAAPAAYAALTYTDEFLRVRGPVLLALVLVNLPIAVVVLVRGRRPALLRRVETVLAVLTCAAMVWAVFGGPILASPDGDRTAKGALLLIVVGLVATAAVQWLRRVRPMPDRTPPLP
jgi:hypothetical protein